MAEVLIVVAIIVVLMGVGFIALMSHMRNMQKLEMDGQAKEIFVAAQNHLSMAKSQDYLGVAEYKKSGETTTSTGDFGIVEDADNHIYYIVVNNASAERGKGDPLLAQMLPFASVNEAARTGGSYIIRYQKDPAQILDVFYVSTTGRYGLASGFKADDDHNDYEEKLKGFIAGTSDVDLKEYGETKAVVGYYGGGTAGIPAGEKLNAPGLEIINGDRLLVRVTNYNDDASNGGTNELVLIVKCNDDSVQFKLKGTDVYSGDRLDSTLSDDHTFTVVLDDVTTAGLHFANLMATAAGSNIEVVARAYNNKLITNIAESPKLTTNSLFASYNESTKTVEIASIRHLLNLDTAISNMPEDVTKNISVAKQISDLVWDDGDATNKGSFLDNTHEADTQIYPYSSTGSPSAKGSYMPVNPPSDLEYQGQSGTNHITGIVVTGGSGDAGLFSSLNRGSVSNLELVDFNISASGNVGALAGSASGTTITSVLVHNSKIGGAEGTTDTAGADKEYKIMSTRAAAGGLIGEASGNVTVTNCAAAVYVAADSDAGGLIGTANTGNLTVESSYSGGHTEKAKYETLTPTVGTKTVVNVQSATGNAGGLIGQASGGLEIKYSYSTASASSEGGSVGIGGLVGKTADGAEIENCYAVGLVTGPADTSAKISPFVAIGNLSTSTGNYYLTSVSPMANVTPGAGVTAVSSGDTSSSLILAEGARGDAIPYDATLTMNYKGKYFFPTVAQLHGSGWTGGEPGITNVHYGDWQIPSMSLLNFKLTNDSILDLQIEVLENTKMITLTVTGDSSSVTRALLLEVKREDSSDTKKVTGLAVKKIGAVQENKQIVWMTSTPDADMINNRVSVDAKREVTKNGKTEVFYDVHISLDDITIQNGHFVQLLANEDVKLNDVAQKLAPGENIVVRVSSGEGSWPELKEVKFYEDLDPDEKAEIDKDYNYCAKRDNSLFAKNTALSGSYYNAQILNIRHLQNLDSAVSEVAAVVKAATLQADVDWTANWNEHNDTENTEDDEIDTIFTSRGKTVEAGKFNGIYNRNLLYFYGNNKTISNLEIGATVGITDDASNAALFRAVPAGSNLTVNNLHLDSPVIASEKIAAAIVAENNGTVTINTVLAEGAASTVNGTTSAGGLVGTTAGKVTIKNSSAALLITSDGAAGGLVGAVTSRTPSGGTTVYGELSLESSYVGGHTYGGKYYVGDTADAGASGRWNIISTSGAAGGLVGEFVTGTSLTVNNCFNTATVYSGSGQAAGGIVGNAAGTFATNGSMYVIAPVASVGTKTYVPAVGETSDSFTAGDPSTKGAIVGVGGSISPSANSVFYLADIYTNPAVVYNQAVTESNIKYIGTGTMTNVEMASYFAGKNNPILGVNDTSHLNDNDGNLEYLTTTYDESIAGKEYPFSIWTTFDGATHFYGDWEPVDREATVDFTFYFLLEDPTETRAEAHAVNRFERGPDYIHNMAIQMVPYEDTQLPIPAVPPLESFKPGMSATNSGIVWTVYAGNQAAMIINGGEAAVTPAVAGQPAYIYTYSETSGAVTLNKTILDAAVAWADAQNEGETNPADKVKPSLTFVAHYYEDENTYFLKLMDYNPNQSTVTYKRLGGIKKLTKDLTYSENETQNGFVVPLRKRPNYKFLGWSTAPDVKTVDKDGKVTISNSGVLVYTPGTEGKCTPVSAQDVKITENKVLYAHYGITTKGTVSVDFILENEGSPQISLDATYVLEYDKAAGFEMNIPLPAGSHLQGQRVMLVTGAGDAATETEVSKTDTDEKAYFVPGVANTDDTHVYIKYSGTADDRHYHVYISGEAQTEKKAYVVRYQFVNTSSVTDPDGNKKYWSTDNEDKPIVVVETGADFSNVAENSYAYSTNKSDYIIIDPYAGDEANHALLSAEGIVPILDDVTVPGFTAYTPEAYSLSEYNEAFPADAANYTDDKITQADGQYAIQWVMVVPLERKTYELSYDSMGGTYVAPESTNPTYGQPIYDLVKAHTGVAAPQRKAHTFKGWAINGLPFVDENGDRARDSENGNQLFISDEDAVMPAAPLKLQAMWAPGNMDFLVVYWLEDANGKAPAYLTFQKQTLPVGTEVDGSTYNDMTTAFADANLNDHLFFFEYDRADKITLEAGSSIPVVNVYYKRKTMTVNFYREGSWTTASSSDTEVYGEVGNDHKPLTYGGETTWSSWNFTPTTSDTASPQFGLENTEYVSLTNQTQYGWKPQYTYSYDYWYGNYVLVDQRYVRFYSSGWNNYIRTTESGNDVEEQYYVSSTDWWGNPTEFERLYWVNGRWYTDQRGRNRYNGSVRYKRISGNTARYSQTSYNGDYLTSGFRRYKIGGDGRMVQVDVGEYNAQTQYFYLDTVNVGNNQTHGYVEITRYSNGSEWYLNGEKYEDTRYVQDKNGTDEFVAGYLDSKIRYKKEGNQYTPTTEDEENATYWGVDDRGGHVKLKKQPGKYYTYDAGNNTQVVYTGEVQVWTTETTTDWTVWRCWEGKYQADYRTYGNSWSQVSDYRWQENLNLSSQPSGTTMTYLSAFTKVNGNSTTYDLYGQLSNVDKDDTYNRIYHYTQSVNGDYSNEKKYLEDGYGYEVVYSTAYSQYTNPKRYFYFKFNNKYEQFEVKKYGSSFAPSDTNMSNIPSNTSNVAAPLHIYHQRRKYDLKFYDGIRSQNSEVTDHVNTIADVYYDKKLKDVSRDDYDFLNPGNKKRTVNNEEVTYYFRGWYRDVGFTDPFLLATQYDSTTKTYQIPATSLTDEVKMTGYDLPLFGKWTPEPSVVSFDAKYLPAAVDPITVEYGETLESRITAGGVYLYAYTPQRAKGSDGTKYAFRYWYYTSDDKEVTGEFTSANHTVFSPSQEISRSLTLYARFDAEEPVPADVTVYYVVVGSDNKPHIDDQTTWLRAPKTESGIVGEPFSRTAPAAGTLNEAYSDYYPVYPTQKITVREDFENKIVFSYKAPLQWDYTLNYYIRYKNLTGEEKEWTLTGFENTNGYVDLKVYSTTPTPGESRYQIVSYSVPFEWMSAYKFDHFAYDTDDDGVKEDHSSNYITIYPDSAGHAVVDVYLVPDVDAIFIEDRNEIYHGSSHAIPSVSFAQNADGNYEYTVQPVPAGTAYTYEVSISGDNYTISEGSNTITVDTSKNTPDQRYLLYDAPVPLPKASAVLGGKIPGKDEDNNPIENTISVKSVSATVHYLYYDPEGNGVDTLSANDVTDAGTYGVRAYITATVTDTANQSYTYLIWQSPDETTKPGLHLYVERRIVFLYSDGNENNPHTYDGTVITLNNPTLGTGNIHSGMPAGWEVGSNYGFAPNEGADFTFSASAFRRNPGTSYNVFKYDLWTGPTAENPNRKKTKETNYNFILKYGALIVVANSGG